MQAVIFILILAVALSHAPNREEAHVRQRVGVRVHADGSGVESSWDYGIHIDGDGSSLHVNIGNPSKGASNDD